MCIKVRSVLGGTNSTSKSSSRSIFQLYFLPEFRVHSGSSSRPIYVSPELILGGQLQTQIQLQIHIWFVHFDWNLGSTLDPAPDLYLGCALRPEFRAKSRSRFGLHFLLEFRDNSGSSSRSIFGLYFLTWI